MENAPGWPENASGRKRRPEQVPLTFKRLAISTIRFRVQIPERRAKAAQKPGNKNFMLKALAKNPSQWRISTTPPNFHISPATFPSWNIKRHAAAPAATTSQLTALVRKTGLTNPCCQIDSKSTQRGADKPVSQPASHLYLYNPPWHPSNPSHCAQRKNLACLKNISIEMQP